MPRSVFEIDVSDEKFKSFLSLYKDYHDSLSSMKGFWTEASDAAAGAETSTGSMVETLAAGAASTALISDAMSRVESSSQRTSSTFGTIADRAKSIAGWIEHATVRLAKWGVLSLGAGLVGGGVGLFGLDRLGEGLAGQRRTAQGLGISTGELNAFSVNFGERLGLGADFLNTVQGAQADLGERWRFTALGIPQSEVQNADTARLTTDVIQRAHALWQEAGAAGHNVQWMQAHGLAGVMSFNQWQQIGLQSQADIDNWGGQYQRDARNLSIADPVQKQWVDFVTQLQRAGQEIDKALIKGLEPLVRSDALQKLSASIVTLVDKFFANDNVIKWIDEFSLGISHLGDYLGPGGNFQRDFKSFIDDIAYAAERMVYILRLLHLIPQETSEAGPSVGPWSAAGDRTKFPYGDAEAEARDAMMFRSYRGGKLDFSSIETANQLPSGLLYAVGMEESSMNPHPADSVVNGKHYQGMFQMGSEAQAHYHVTNPYDPLQEGNAAAMMISDLRAKYHGDLAKALAAYNWGSGSPPGDPRDPRLDADIAEHGAAWRDFLPNQTKKYLNDILDSNGNIRVNVHVSVLNQTGANVAVTANAVRQ